MRVIRHHPAGPLAAYVRTFWWSRRERPEICCEHMLPGCGAQLIFALHETPIVSKPGGLDAVAWSRGVVHGPQRSYYIAGPKPPGAIAGVSFYPGAAGVVLGLPIMEITDRHVPIDDLWGARGRTLHERLMEADNPAEVFGILEQELTARLERPRSMHPAVAHALTARRDPRLPIRISEIHREAGYSSRHFIALFRSAVGLTPKHFYRVRRFTSVVQHLAGASPANLADLAVALNYSDQSHLTREFRDFAGITPTQYRPRDQGSALHHRVHMPVAGLAQGKKTSRHR